MHRSENPPQLNANRRDVAATHLQDPERTFVLAKSGDALKKDFALIRR